MQVERAVASARQRVSRTIVVAMAIATIALIGAACGSGSASPGVANVGSTTTTTTAGSASGNSGPSGVSNYQASLAYSNCMRSHGVPNFPDPTSNGAFKREGGVLNGQRVDLNSPQAQSAEKTCQHLLPNGGKMTPAEQQAALANALKYSECMRSHGLTNFPDPTTRNGGVSIQIRANGNGGGINPNSPQFQAAQKVCGAMLGINAKK